MTPRLEHPPLPLCLDRIARLIAILRTQMPRLPEKMEIID